LPAVILKNSKSDDWRKNAKKVGFYLDLGLLINEEGKSNEWAEFSKKELARWRTKDEEADKEGKCLTDGQVKLEDDIPRKTESPAEKEPEGIAVGDLSKPEQTKKDDFANFPTFEAPKKDEGGFGGFPSFDQPKQEKEDSGFGSFPTFDEPKKEEPGFGSFPKFDEPKKEDSGFGGFPSFDAPKKEEPGFGSFPKFDEPKKEDAGFGGFPKFDAPAEAPKKEVKPVAPVKPAQPEAEVDVSFEHFLELINNPCWEYNGPSPAELFGQKDQFANADEAFEFIKSQF
jgi:hypothetical protein